MSLNQNFSVEENELLLTHTAAVKQVVEGDPAEVVLVGQGSQRTLCTCANVNDARLIKTLFNNGLKLPQP